MKAWHPFFCAQTATRHSHVLGGVARLNANWPATAPKVKMSQYFCPLEHGVVERFR
jgi:hypothetical protein